MARQTEADIIVEVPIEVAYRAWSDFESFPRFMTNVSAVRRIEPRGRRLHWIATVAGTSQEWDAEITDLTPNQRVAWRSISGSANDGAVELEPDGDRTHITLRLRYDPPVGIAGDAAESLVVSTQRTIHEDLRTFKQLVETGSTWWTSEAAWLRWVAVGTGGAAVLVGASIGTWYGLQRHRVPRWPAAWPRRGAAPVAVRRNATPAASLARAVGATQATSFDALERRVPLALWYWVGVGAFVAAAGLHLADRREWSVHLGQLSTTALLLALLHQQAPGARQA